MPFPSLPCEPWRGLAAPEVLALSSLKLNLNNHSAETSTIEVFCPSLAALFKDMVLREWSGQPNFSLLSLDYSPINRA